MPKSSYDFKGYLGYGPNIKLLSRIVDLDFVKALKPTFNMPESLDLWISAILNCSCFGF